MEDGKSNSYTITSGFMFFIYCEAALCWIMGLNCTIAAWLSILQRKSIRTHIEAWTMESHKAVESLQQSNTDHGTWVAKKLLACTNTKLQFFPWPRSIQCFGSTGFHKIVLCWHPFLQSNEIWFGKLLWLSKVCLPCSSAWVNLASKPWPATCGTSITSALGAAWAHAWQPCFAFYLWHCLGLCLCLGCRLGFGM